MTTIHPPAAQHDDGLAEADACLAPLDQRIILLDARLAASQWTRTPEGTNSRAGEATKSSLADAPVAAAARRESLYSLAERLA